MTLDEAIKHEEEVAEGQIKSAEMWAGYSESKYDCHLAKKAYDSCQKCASEHHQLAEWLRELKELKERVQQNEKAILKIQKDFKGYVDLLNMPRDDYNGIMEYIDELSSVTPRTESEE